MDAVVGPAAYTDARAEPVGQGRVARRVERALVTLINMLVLAVALVVGAGIKVGLPILLGLDDHHDVNTTPALVAEVNAICLGASDALELASQARSAELYRRVPARIAALVAGASGDWDAVVAGMVARERYVQASADGASGADPRQAVEDRGTGAQLRLGVQCSGFS
jgi:hypothetical protein